jgi:hypothetical protein
MFLDPFHEPHPGEYDHLKSTRWMRYFAREALEKSQENDTDLQIVTTLYGPPAWMTKQRMLRGRDLDPAKRIACADYMVSWTKYLREIDGLPVRYISLHNEGEDWVRWPDDGGDGPEWGHHDYNLYWSPEQVVDFIKLLKQRLVHYGIENVGVACGETSNWQRFYDWGYADAIVEDPEAVSSLDLITSHGFSGSTWNRWHGDWRSVGVDVIRAKKPDLHAWVTSTSWSNMDVDFVNEIRNNIYSAKVNGIIPWAGIQVRGGWVGGDPNPGTAIPVSRDGIFEVQSGYWYYKQVSNAGQPGMGIAKVSVNETILSAIAFSSNGTSYPNALVLSNLDDRARLVEVVVDQASITSCKAYRTSQIENFVDVLDIDLIGNFLRYTAPERSVTTFFIR